MKIDVIVGLTKSGKVRKVEKVMTTEEIDNSTLAKIGDNTYVKQEVREEVCEKLGIAIPMTMQEGLEEEKYIIESTRIDEENLLKEETNMIATKKEVKEVIEQANQITKEVNEMKIKVDYAIRYAIKDGKGAKSDVKFVSAKQIDAIVKSYQEITGAEMSGTQVLCIRTLNPKQISNIIHTLNTAKKKFISCKELQSLNQEFKNITGDELTDEELAYLEGLSKIERQNYMRYTKSLVAHA